MLTILFWITFGVVIGWVTVILQGAKESRDVILLLTAGAIGGLVGGFLGALLDPSRNAFATSPTDIIFSIFGATGFALIVSRTLINRNLPHKTN